MKPLIMLAALLTAHPAFGQAGGGAAAAAEVAKAWAEAGKEIWGVVKEVTIDVREAMKTQAPNVTKGDETFRFNIEGKCDPVARFDSNEHEPVAFGFGGNTDDEKVWYHLIWSGVECDAPKEYAADGPAKWIYLRSARFVPLQTVAISGYDMTIRLANGEVAPKRLADKGAKGQPAPTPIIYMGTSVDLHVTRKNLNREESFATTIAFDAMGGCTFTGHRLLTLMDGSQCFVKKAGVKASSDMPKSHDRQ